MQRPKRKQPMQQMELPGDLVTVTGAAAELTLNKSTVSRQVRALGLPLYGGKFSLSAYKAAREESLDPGQQRAAATQSASTYQAHRTDLERTKAIKAGIELAQLQGSLLDRRAVEDFLATAAREMREAMTRRWRTLAAELAGLDARQIEDAGICSDEKLLADLAQRFETMSAPEDAASAV